MEPTPPSFVIRLFSGSLFTLFLSIVLFAKRGCSPQTLGDKSMDIDTEVALRKDADSRVRAEVAQRANLRIDTEVVLRTDKEVSVRVALATNPTKLRIDTEIALRKDKSADVRAALAQRRDLSLDSIVALRQDPSPSVRAALARSQP